jgi:hypothetical protein
MHTSQKVQDFYKQKSWCDAKDGLGVWRVARIKKRQKKIITVHFDGWSEKWKQTYCLDSALIAPFRMHSIGYTGQSKKALRDWDFNEDSIKTSEGMISILLHGNFSGLSPYELTLFIRGDLYMQVDCLMSYSYSNPSKEIPRVTEFLSEVLDMIVKWMSIVPTEIKNCDFDSPDRYLYNNSDAFYKSAYEIMDMLNTIFGFVKRNSNFYEKYKQFASTKTFIQYFFNKDGMKHLINMIKVVHLENFWHSIINIPSIFSISTVAVNERYILNFTESLINQLESLNPDVSASIINRKEDVDKFMLNMENMIDLVSSLHQKENYMNFFRKFFRIRQPVSKKDLDDEIPRLSLISPRHKQTTLPSTRNKNLKIISPLKRSEAFKPPTFETNDMINNIKELIEKKHLECVKLIESRLNAHKETQDKLELVFKEHQSCDHQEFALLSTIEFLITENKTEEALKVIKWRKKILKISAMNGWKIAQEVSKRTLSKLDVTSSDIIEANLKNI